MKKLHKFFLLLLSFLLCISFVSCKPDEEEPDTPSEDPVTEENYIYKDGSKLHIVYDGDNHELTNILMEIYNYLGNKYYCQVFFASDTSEGADHELIIGNVDCEISVQAYNQLERIEYDENTEVRYLVYSDGNSLAVAYDADKYDVNASVLEALNIFYNDYVKNENKLSLDAGVVYSGKINPVEYQKPIDEAKREEEWNRVFTEAGGDDHAAEIVAALREYYGMFDSSVISWLANLYDKETGAFYYSNSGRNTAGYGPDIETTQQAIGFLESTGVLDCIGGAYYLPDTMMEPLGKWVKGLQDPNGYFYHPQWSKALVDSKISRRGRDLNRGLYLLGIAGVRPTYDTPTGGKGDYTLYDGTKVDKEGNPISPASYLTGKLLGNSPAYAVSKIVSAVSAYVAPHLRDEASFRAWLGAFDIRGNSYSVANTIASSASEILVRDKQLREEGADYSFVDIIEKWLIENQNPKNGTWEWTPGVSPISGNNGVLKFADMYNILGIEFPNPERAIENAIDIIYGEYATSSVCDTYNTWFAINLIFQNLRKFTKDSAATEAQIKAIVDRLRADAPELIINTRDKVFEYRKDDGSFSYTKTESAATSQGVPVAVPHTNEGDVNATTISINGTMMHMFEVLGLTQPKLFGKAEYIMFTSIIDGLGDIVKDPEPEPDPVDFDDYDIGETTVDLVNTDDCASSGDFVVIADPREGHKGNVYLMDSKNNGGDALRFVSASSALSASCYVFETEMMIESGDEGTTAQIVLHRTYMLAIRISDGVAYFSDSSSQTAQHAIYRDFNIGIPFGEWFDLRVEYYPGDHDTVRAVTYINGKAIAISDNYYDGDGNKLTKDGVPSAVYDWVQVVGFSDKNIKMMFDNVGVYKQQKTYSPENFDHTSLLFDIDPPDSDELIYDFADGKLPSDFNVKKGEGVLSVTDKLTINSKGSAALDIDIPENKRTSGTNVSVFEAVINVSSASAGSKIELSFRENAYDEKPLARLRLIPTSVDGTNYLTICESSAGTDGKIFDAVLIKYGKDTTLRIEYYQDKQSILIYVDGTLTALTSAVCSNANKYMSAKIKIENAGAGSFNISLDNIKAEGITKSFDEATKPDVERENYTFDNGIPEKVVTSGTVDATDGQIILGSENSLFTIPLNKRGFATTVMNFEFDITVPATAADGDSVRLTVLSAEGTPMLEFVLNVREGRVYIHESTAAKFYSSVTSFEAGKKARLTFDYFSAEETINVYLDGVPLLVSSVLYTPSAGAIDAAKLSFTGTRGTGFAFDNIIFETFNKIFENESVFGENTESNNETVTFEDSTTGILPTRLTTSFKTAAAKILVREYMTKAGISKVLAFTSGTGNQDALTFTATGSKDSVDVNSIIFSADLKIDYVAGGNYEIRMRRADGALAYLMLLYRSKDKFVIYDISGNSEYNVPGRIFGMTKSSGVSTSEEINIKIEVYFGTKETVRYKTYINGDLLYVSDNYYGKSTLNTDSEPILNIASIDLATYGDTAATMYIDNVRFAYGKLTLADDPLNGAPTVDPDDPENPDESFVFGQGAYYKANGGIVYEKYSALWNGLGLKNEGDGIVTRPGAVVVGDSEGTSSNPGIMLTTIGNDNKVLKYTTSIAGSGEYSKCIAFQPEGGFTAATTYIFETDLYLSAADASMISGGRTFATFSLETEQKITNNEATRIRASMATNEGANVYMLFDKFLTPETWYNIAIVYDYATGKTDTYINNELAKTYNLSAEIEVKYINFSMNNAMLGAYAMFDSTYIGSNGETSPEEPEETFIFGDGAYYKANGGIVYEKYSALWNGLGLKNEGDGIVTRPAAVVSGDSEGTSSNPGIMLTTIGNDNKVLKYTTSIAGSGEYSKCIAFQPEGGFTVAKTYIFETDLYLSAADASMISGGRTFATFSLETEQKITNNEATRIRASMATNKGANVYMLFDKFLTPDTWYNIAIVYDYATGKTDTYINNELAKTYNLSAEIEVKYINFSMNNAMRGAYAMFDSTYIASTGVREENTEPAFVFGEGAYYKANGGIVYEKYSTLWNGLGLKNEGDGIVTRPGAVVVGDSEGTSSNPGIMLTTIANDNKVLKYTTSTSGSGEYSKCIAFQPEGGFGEGTVYVFETDLYLSAADASMISGGRTFATFSLETEQKITNNEATRIRASMATNEGANVYMLFDKFLTPDTWYNIAIEYDSATGTTNTYINGELAKTYTLSADIDVKYINFSMNNAMLGAYAMFDCTYIGTK